MGGRALWLADELRRWGLPVAEVDGWRDLGKATLNPGGTICHHDALSSSTTAAAALALMVHGRSDLPGPLCNLWLDDDNDHTAATGDPLVYVVAAGKANHAGAGNWFGLSGNSSVLGIEARNNGRGEAWSPPMLLTYMRTCAALQTHLGRHAGWVAGHKEYATPKGRKVDPVGFDMTAFRSGVQAIMDKGPDPAAPPPFIEPVTPPPVQDAIAEDLRRTLFYVKQTLVGPGQANDPTAVQFVQAAITRIMGRPVAAGDGLGVFGPFTAQSVKDLQRFLRMTVDGIVGPKVWAVLYPPS